MRCIQDEIYVYILCEWVVDTKMKFHCALRVLSSRVGHMYTFCVTLKHIISKFHLDGCHFLVTLVQS